MLNAFVENLLGVLIALPSSFLGAQAILLYANSDLGGFFTKFPRFFSIILFNLFLIVLSVFLVRINLYPEVFQRVLSVIVLAYLTTLFLLLVKVYRLPHSH